MGVMRVKPKPCPFQPTLPARGATPILLRKKVCKNHFNPRSPHGERLDFQRSAHIRCHISTHAPRTGSDDGAPNVRPDLLHFNPRSPHGERHGCGGCGSKKPDISTHAPRTGSDALSAVHPVSRCPFQPTLPARGATPLDTAALTRLYYFNPRSPHGERRIFW